MSQDRYSLNYRAAEAHQLMDWIKAGQSGCLIGLRGAGKSNFLRFILRQTVRQHYLGPDDTNYTFVHLDMLALVEPKPWAVYELILERLMGQLRQAESPAAAVEEITALYREVAPTQDPLRMQRAIEQGIAIFCRQPQQQLILLFDEFDGVFRTVDAALFHFLRTLRDAHKDQISIIIVVTDDLAYLRDDLTEVEHFYRLVSRNVCGLGPYSEADARQMVGYLASRRSMEFSEADVAHLVQQSGGHAGLLKSILSRLWAAPQASHLEAMVPHLHKEPVVEAECRKVWAGLSETEQVALKTLLGGMTIDDPLTQQRLQRKGVLAPSQAAPAIFSPVFTNFVRRQTSPPVKSTVISRSPRRVELAGRPIKNLTELEFELLCYLYKNRERICTKNDLIAKVYRHQYETDGGTDQMLQQLVRRLRKKIEPNPGQPRYIVTVRGEGYKFVEETSTTK